MAAHGEAHQCGHTPAGQIRYEHDYGSPTELDLEYYAVFGDLVPLPNLPRAGVNRYDNFHSWGAWPLAESDGW